MEKLLPKKASHRPSIDTYRGTSHIEAHRKSRPTNKKPRFLAKSRSR
jgi:hypothetical protein